MIGTLVDEIQARQQALQGKPHKRDVFAIWQRDGKLTDYTISGTLTVIGALAQTRKRPYTRSGQRVILFEHTGIAACMAEVATVRQDRVNAAAAVTAKNAEIEQAVIDAYANGCADPLWQTIQGLSSAADTAVALPAGDTIDADDVEEEQQ